MLVRGSPGSAVLLASQRRQEGVHGSGECRQLVREDGQCIKEVENVFGSFGAMSLSFTELQQLLDYVRDRVRDGHVRFAIGCGQTGGPRLVQQ